MKLLIEIKNLLYFLKNKYQKSKVHIYEASLIGNGSIVDIRYWLTRPDKVIHNGNIYLVDEETGVKIFLIRISKYGVMRTRHNNSTITGILLFYNQNRIVKPGSKISVCLDNLTATNVDVK